LRNFGSLHFSLPIPAAIYGSFIAGIDHTNQDQEAVMLVEEFYKFVGCDVFGVSCFISCVMNAAEAWCKIAFDGED
jgi:hypothetical protein